ncbi:MAG: glycosyltransferase family 2 protein [Candidatus Pacearchaeota archaeon]|nr:glycosyltransferase family 2 protein [Candidatus Pacearchaeota archaeon]
MNREISVILPCYNEEKSLGFCIDEIRKVSRENNLNPEIIVVDNNSIDRSREIAKEKKVNYLFEEKKGYGSAYLAGLKSANGQILIMADCDGSYDFNDMPKFLNELENNDLVVGNRANKNLLPILNRIGGFLINKMLKRKGLNIKESCTGFIGIKKEKLDLLNLKKQGMEFSSELLVRANEKELKIQEIDINFRQRIGKSKLKIFRDGFRHLKFLLLGI